MFIYYNFHRFKMQNRVIYNEKCADQPFPISLGKMGIRQDFLAIQSVVQVGCFDKRNT